MPENKLFLPEGLRPPVSYTLAELKSAQKEHTILEAPVLRCDTDHTLHVSLGGISGIIPKKHRAALLILSSWLLFIYKVIVIFLDDALDVAVHTVYVGEAAPVIIFIVCGLSVRSGLGGDTHTWKVGI